MVANKSRISDTIQIKFCIQFVCNQITCQNLSPFEFPCLRQMWTHLSKHFFFISRLFSYTVVFSVQCWSSDIHFLAFIITLSFHSIIFTTVAYTILKKKRRKNQERKGGGMERDMRMAEITKYILVIVATLEIYVTATLNMWA